MASGGQLSNPPSGQDQPLKRKSVPAVQWCGRTEKAVRRKMGKLVSLSTLSRAFCLLVLLSIQSSLMPGALSKARVQDDDGMKSNYGNDAAKDDLRTAEVHSYLSDQPKYILPHLLVGGTGGMERGVLHDYVNGGVLEELFVWVSTVDSEDMFCLVKINATFTSGATFAVGSDTNSPTMKSFRFEPGERITQLSLWGNGKRTVGGRVAAVQFVTDRGRKFDQGVPMARRGLEEQFVGEDLGSGIAVGLHARSELAIDALALYFLRPIRSATVQVDSYPELDLAPLGGTPRKVASAVFTNSYMDSQPMNLTAVGNVKTYHEWQSATVSGTFGQSQFSVVAPVPIVHTISGRSSWATSNITAFSTNKHVADEELSLLFNVTLDPLERWESCATATVYEISNPLAFRGQLSLKTENHGVWEFPISGTYTGSAFAAPTISGVRLPITSIFV